MKFLKTTISVVVLMLSAQASAAQFETDNQHFHVDGQSINAALLQVNQIICSISAMRTDKLVNDGPYLATVYEEDCSTTAVDASGESSKATKGSSQSASAASATTATGTVDAKTAQTSVVSVRRPDLVSPSEASIWLKTAGKKTDDWADKWNTETFALVEQSGEITDTAPNGEFEMIYSTHIDGTQVDEDNNRQQANQVVGQGYIKASGTLLQFRGQGQSGEDNIAAKFFPNGDKSGIYGERANYDTWDWEANDYQSPEDLGLSWDDYPTTEVEAFYQFYLSAADKGYCRRLMSAERKQRRTDEERDARYEAAQQEVDALYDAAYVQLDADIEALYVEVNAYTEEEWEALGGNDYFQAQADIIYAQIDWDAINNQANILYEAAGADQLIQIYNVASGLDDLANYGKSELVVGEECFTLDETKVQRNVHRYGVYNLDGTRLSVGNPPFSMVAQVTETIEGTEIEQTTEAYAWAGYWGTHVDQRTRSLVTEDTVFEKEGYREETEGDKQTYKLKSTDIRMEKRSTSYVALNDINRISLNMWIDDDWWKTQYTALWKRTLSYQELEGSFDKNTQTFTFTKAFTHEPYTEVDLGRTPIIFTVAEWQASMFKEWGVSVDKDNNRVEEDWYQKEIRNLGVWSHDTGQWYEINDTAMTNPTSATRQAGIRTESSKIISASDITETLYCMDRCIDGAKLEVAFTQAVDANRSTADPVPSPYSQTSERLQTAVTKTEVYSPFQSFNEASDGFSSSITTNTDNQLILGDGGIAITDYVSGNRSLPRYSRGNFDGGDDSKLYYRSWDGFSKGNIQSLLNVNNKTADAAEVDRLLSTIPSVSIDLKSIPAAGASGTMRMIVSLFQGNNDSADSGERAVSAAADLNWSSNGSEFSIGISAGTPITYTLLSSDNSTAVQSSYIYPRNSTFGYSGQELDIHKSALLRTGLRFKLFNLFVGSGRLQQLIDADFSTFFDQDGAGFVGKITMTNTDLRVRGEFQDGNQTSPTNAAMFTFGINDDVDFLYTTEWQRGQWAEGLQIEDMDTYNVVGGKLVDKNGNELTKGATARAALAAVEDPSTLLGDVVYPLTSFDDPTESGIETRSLEWGVNSGELVPVSELANLECRKNGKDQLYDSHPVYGQSTTTRYCAYQIWDGGVTTKYSFNVESHPQYEVFYANAVEAGAVIGAKVIVAEPKTMYYTVPETTGLDGNPLFGKDAGKRIRLDFNGHGELWGIPGFVYDTATNADLGDHIQGEWKSTYRYLSRFIMADGSKIKDGIDETIEYKVKALEGEVWLTKADGTISGVGDLGGRYTSFYDGTVADLADEREMTVLGFEDWGTFDTTNGNWLNSSPDGINDNDNYLGARPTPTVNGGDTAVVHGEVIFDPSP